MIWHILILFAELVAANDQDLIERLRRRDPDAMSDLYDRYSRVVYSVILRDALDQPFLLPPQNEPQ